MYTTMSTSSIDSIVDVTTTPTPTTRKTESFGPQTAHKVFECAKPQCLQKFDTKDKLMVHKQKHEMKLKIGESARILDDTPTPSRFLKVLGEPNLDPVTHEQEQQPTQLEQLKLDEDVQEQQTEVFTEQFTRQVEIPYNQLISGIPTTHNTFTIDNMTSNNIANFNDSNLNPDLSTVTIEVKNNNNNNNNASITDFMPFNPRNVNENNPFPNSQIAQGYNSPEFKDSEYDDSGSSTEEFGEDLIINTHNCTTKTQLIKPLNQASSSDSVQSDSVTTTTIAQHMLPISMNSEISNIDLQPTKKKRGRKPILDEDPVEKRKRYLQRNREAATRCRNKKKKWVAGLEGDMDVLLNKNKFLSDENKRLKSQIEKYATYSCLPNVKDIQTFNLQLHSVAIKPVMDDGEHSYMPNNALHSPTGGQPNILAGQHPNLYTSFQIAQPIRAPINTHLYPNMESLQHNNRNSHQQS